MKIGYLSANFSEKEFGCNHCGSLGDNGIDSQLLEVLEDLRAHFGGRPVTVISGYRCKTHNTRVGSNERSQHRKGTAADIVVAEVSPKRVRRYLKRKYRKMYGIGSYSTFTHIDVRANGPARWRG